MNIKKTVLQSALSLLVSNLVEKAVLHDAGLYKSTIEATDNFQRRQI